MSKSPVYGRQVSIDFFTDSGQNGFTLCELESFSYKFDDEVKMNTVLGEAGIGSIDVLDKGGTVSCETSERDFKVLAYFVNQTRQIRAGSGGDLPSISGVRGSAPYFTIKVTTTYLDGNYSEIKFEGLKLHNLNGDITGSNNENKIKFEGTFTRTSLGGSNAGDSSTAGIADIINTGVSNIGTVQEADETAGQIVYSENFTGL